MLLLIVVLVLLFGVGGGYWGYQRSDGNWVNGGGIGLGTILVILLILYLLGGIHR